METVTIYWNFEMVSYECCFISVPDILLGKFFNPSKVDVIVVNHLVQVKIITLFSSFWLWALFSWTEIVTCRVSISQNLPFLDGRYVLLACWISNNLIYWLKATLKFKTCILCDSFRWKSIYLNNLAVYPLLEYLHF